MTTNYQKYGKKYYLKSKDRFKKNARSWHLKKKYGITVEQYDEILKSQYGSCAICDRIFDINLAVDHNHETGKIRGLLCFVCNVTVGNYELGVLPSEDQIKGYLAKHG